MFCSHVFKTHVLVFLKHGVVWKRGRGHHCMEPMFQKRKTHVLQNACFGNAVFRVLERSKVAGRGRLGLFDGIRREFSGTRTVGCC